MNIMYIFFMIFITALLASCGNDDIKESKQSKKIEIVKRDTNPQIYSYGQKLFLQNCASCHGKHAEGDKNWRKLNEKGQFPPPPLDGTGHTWHHSSKVLVNTIKNGTAKIGGSMPAWKDQLSDMDIEAILVYLQALWSDEIYTAWYNNQHPKK